MRRGFTLIELLAAVAILAVVSIMAAQLLSVAMLQRDLLIRRDQDGAALLRALTLLRRDFEAIVPVPNAEGQDPTVEAALTRATDGQLRLIRAGLISVDGPLAPRIAAVIWALRDGTLVRSQNDPAQDTGAAGPAPVLAGVTDFAVVPLGVDPATDDPAHPAPGYEITLQTEAWGPLRLVVAR